MQFVNDPTEFPPVGAPAGVLVGPRTQSGEAFLWEPGGDAEALVRLCGEHHLVSVGGVVYDRQDDGTLTPAAWLQQKVVIVKPPAGDTFAVTLDEMTRRYARVDVAGYAKFDGIREVPKEATPVPPSGDFVAVPVATDAEPAKRGPGRPKGSTNKKPPSTEV